MLDRILKEIVILAQEETKNSPEGRDELIKAAGSFAEDGLNQSEASPNETLYLVEDPEEFDRLTEKGLAAVGYHPAGRPMQKYHGAFCIVEEPQELEWESWELIFRRIRKIPWVILETEHCVLREMIPEDEPELRKLYDSEAIRFLEPPSENERTEREILEAYIEKAYGFYGYGMWAVVEKASGELIGKAGYEHGMDSSHEIFLGYLLRKDKRRQGIAGEVVAAIVRYGFEVLCLEEICAETAPENLTSRALLQKLGFEQLLKECSEEKLLLLQKK